MYSIHLKPEVSTLRIYENEDSYEKRSPPLFSCTVHFISDSKFYICNGSGKLGRKMLRVLFKYFYDLGYSTAQYERNKVMKTVNLNKLFKRGQ